MDIIRHCNITQEQLNDIARLKAKAWPGYSVRQHIRWMESNLKYKDYHIMLNDNGLKAYMNIFTKWVILDSKETVVYGSGNLCSLGTGYGFILLKQLPLHEGYFGFCKPELLRYYQLLGWKAGLNVCMPNVDLVNYIAISYNLQFNQLTYLDGRF